MTCQDRIENLLAQTVAPKLVEGSHKATLKQELLDQVQETGPAMQKEGWTMGKWKKRLVWACCLAVAVVGTAWAAQKVVRTYVVHREEPREITVSGADGPVTYSSSGMTTITSNDPDFTEERAKQLHQETQKAIAEGRCELVKVTETDFGSAYHYKFVLPDGTEHGFATNEPLDSPRSREDVLQEVQNQIDEGVGELIAIGRFDFGKFYMYRFTLSDGLVKTLARNAPYLGSEDAVFEEIEALIAQGDGELLRSPNEVSHQYCYKFILSDGTPMQYLTDSALP